MEQAKALADRARRTASFLKALSNDKRLLILRLLSRREHSVGELERALEIRQPTLSQQLAILREHELVEARRDGKSIYYRMTSRESEVVIGVLDELFSGAGSDGEGAGRSDGAAAVETAASRTRSP